MSDELQTAGALMRETVTEINRLLEINAALLFAAKGVRDDCDCPIGVEGQHRVRCERLRAAIRKAEGTK